MDPYHLFILFQLCDALSKGTVHLTISLPEFLSSQVILEVIKTLKVMEERSQNCLMEIEELFDCLLIKEDRYASIVLEDFGDLLSFTLVLRDYTRPSNPYDLNHLSLLS